MTTIEQLGVQQQERDSTRNSNVLVKSADSTTQHLTAPTP